MDRVVRSSSGRQIYGQKWQNTEGSNEIESDEGLYSPSHESTSTNVVIEPQITGSSSDRRSMYRAALQGDWDAAEMLLKKVPTLARDEITERGDRALHVAVAMKHEVFVQKLVERMSPSDLELRDGHGNTACCYAAISGIVEIADVMIKKNPNLGTARDQNGTTPLHKAALHPNARMVFYFLKPSKVEDLSNEEWFDLLLATIRSKMYGAALEILEKNGSLATMTNKEGTALHLLAGHEKLRYDISIRGTTNKKMESSELLAKKLWAEIQRLEEASVLELMRKPPILHNAAKIGNTELISTLTHTYPDLIGDTDGNGYTMFHIAVIYRQEEVFKLIHKIGATKKLIAISQDKNRNNILHLAGKLAHPNAGNMISISALQLQSEIAWFKQVEAIVPTSCVEKTNDKGYTPTELFSLQHNDLLEKSKTWMRNTANSCILVATLMLTVVFTAAFTVPGGFNEKSGIPILLKGKWFTCFVIFEALALFHSLVSVMMFWSIMRSSFEEREFLENLPRKLQTGIASLYICLFATISAFVSAYFLVFVEARGAFIKTVIIFVCIVLYFAIVTQFNYIVKDVRQSIAYNKKMEKTL